MKKLIAGLLFIGGLSAAHAQLLTIDQVIFQSGTGVTPAGFSGTLNYTANGNTATFVVTNTSLDSAVTNNTIPAQMLLTGFGVQLGSNILSGTVNVTAGSTALNFDLGQSLTNVSNQYAYANQSIDGYNLAGALTVGNVVSSLENGQSTPFAGPPPVTIDGPGYGTLSLLETQFGSSTPGIRDSVTVVLNLSGPAPSWAALNAGNVVLAIGSPDTVRAGGTTPGGGGEGVPEGGSTVALLGLALGAVALVRRKLA